MALDSNEITDGITSGIEIRKQRGLEIAATKGVERIDFGFWKVSSQSGNGRYTVYRGISGSSCNCPDHETRGCACKHIYAVECVLNRESTTHPDGSMTVTESVTITAIKRKTYKQDWPNYNAAQKNEKAEFQRLLSELTRDLVTEKKSTGRPPLPLSDTVFACVFKVYSKFSGRRFTTDLNDAKVNGYINRAASYNSIFDYFEDPKLTPILTDLIVRTSLPLCGVETCFAVDSTGFTSSRFVKWFDHKYGEVKQEHHWVKAHICTGVKTNIITAVEIHDKNANDAPLLPALVATTANGFPIGEVSADKGYISAKNLETVQRHGGTPYIAFKSNTVGRGDGVWAKAFHYFQFKREEFLQHYHKRSNVESTFSMIKAKFSDAVASKTDVAMKNEVLAKILCHNICVLISAIYELGLEVELGKVA